MYVYFEDSIEYSLFDYLQTTKMKTEYPTSVWQQGSMVWINHWPTSVNDV